jgi:hypothetical protein
MRKVTTNEFFCGIGTDLAGSDSRLPTWRQWPVCGEVEGERERELGACSRAWHAQDSSQIKWHPGDQALFFCPGAAMGAGVQGRASFQLGDDTQARLPLPPSFLFFC